MIIDLQPLTAGRRLKTVRVAQGLSQWDLARRASVQPGRLSELENERRPGSAAEWERLADALGISLCELQPA
jgi:transcriptional regulator with XRE-family HTH domain